MSEWIGFLIAIFFVGYSILRWIWQIFAGPQEGQDKGSETLRNFLKSLEVEEDEEVVVPPPPKPAKPKKVAKERKVFTQSPLPAQKTAFHTQYDSDKDAYKQIGHRNVPQGKQLLKDLPTKRDLFIYQVIINPPKGL